MHLEACHEPPSRIRRARAPERSHVCACARLSSYTRIAAETGSLGINRGGAGIILDTAAHPTATMPYLTSGRADRLSGRFCSANWEMAEVGRDWKDLIVQK
ncbi:hypothetical protein DFH94DRAFT_772925 [Russula ochroleuca]|uniref:Uncharacterized protein n=1 Tax=Russula ochroleuca TaxID=152965 RepID=A0A9P5MQY6_9AGAM|nr:hypothetical protein DFH94DRAFT_772925 [Russula ochroleuca]